jgi:hypothetical protein
MACGGPVRNQLILVEPRSSNPPPLNADASLIETSMPDQSSMNETMSPTIQTPHWASTALPAAPPTGSAHGWIPGSRGKNRPVASAAIVGVVSAIRIRRSFLLVQVPAYWLARVRFGRSAVGLSSHRSAASSFDSRAACPVRASS